MTLTIRDSILRYLTGGYAGPGPEACNCLSEYIISQMARDGGFVDRNGKSDLYYTVFGLQLMKAVGLPVPHERLSGYLQGLYPLLPDMDLVEVASYGRCFGFLSLEYRFNALRDKIAGRISDFATADGGYALDQHEKVSGSSYAAFLAVNAIQDIGINIDNSFRLVDSLQKLSLPDGSFVNDINMPVGLVPTTAAAMILHKISGLEIPCLSADWLLSCFCADGGLAVAPGAEMDLLSTAVGLFALAYCGFGHKISIEQTRQMAARLDTLVLSDGSYRGSMHDNYSDCEYTCYGLLARGIIRELNEKTN
ncbi:MAG: terpene cyclase/mutase family protein [Sedimentisphaerales bacterium]|nr:terpene cyclase/mutase family protein [Sedimentisphaerales bacterium]